MLADGCWWEGWGSSLDLGSLDGQITIVMLLRCHPRNPSSTVFHVPPDTL